MLVPSANSSLISPSPVQPCETMSVTPTRPVSTSSWGIRISRSISAGAAPAQLVVTVMTGRRTSGVSWIGMVWSASRPNRTTISTAATTATGRSIARRMMFIA